MWKILMSEVQLTEKEKTTLYGLVRYPNLNDRELSEKIEEKLSTVTAIRRRLRENDYFVRKRIPFTHNLGCELLAIGYGKFNTNIDDETRREFCKKELQKHPNIFLNIDSRGMGFFMCMTRNYTEVKKIIDGFQYFATKHNLIGDDHWTFAIFPFEVSKILNCFDYSTILRKLFGIDDKADPVSLEYEKRREVSLSNKEKSVYYGLVRYPELHDNTVAKKVGASRQAVSNMSKRFLKENLLQTARIPNLEKLGYEIIALAHTNFNPRTPLKERKKGIEMMVSEVPQFFMVSGNFENILLAAAKDYEDFNNMKNRVLSFYGKHSFITGEPRIYLFSLKETDFVRNFDFAPVVKMALGI